MVEIILAAVFQNQFPETLQLDPNLKIALQGSNMGMRLAT